MLRQEQIPRAVVENMLWFVVSLVLAFFVWVIAIGQSDPISDRQYRQIPIQIEADAGLIITNTPTNMARVAIRAQQSVLVALTTDDIVVRADLAGRGPGTHTIALNTEVNRRASVIDTQPTQITVVLEQIEAKKIPVVARVEQDINFSMLDRDEPIFNVNQVEVSGASSRVDEVVAVESVLDLSQQRNLFEQDIRLVPINTDGEVVERVTLDPPTVRVEVNIFQRNDVREVAVRPNILFDTLPEGYFLSSISYEPQSVLLSGDLSQIPEALFTAPIDLTGRQSNFQVNIPVELPNGVQLLGAQDIAVMVGIAAPTSNRQFVDIPVEITGLSSVYKANISPHEVTVLVTGPQPSLLTLLPEDIHVVVDLAGYGIGNHDIVPRVSLPNGAANSEGISVLPASIDIEILPLNDDGELPTGR